MKYRNRFLIGSILLFVVALSCALLCSCGEEKQQTTVGVPVASDDVYISDREVYGKDKSAKKIEIKNTYNGHSVSAIKEKGFSGYIDLEEVVIPSGILSIGANAFEGCINLKTIKISGQSTHHLKIGEEAFKGCTSLKEISLPSRVNSIGYAAFSGCGSLKSITLPFVGESMSSVDSSSLFGYIFGSAKYEGSEAVTQRFEDNLDSSVVYYIPEGLTKVTVEGGSLNYGAFYNCNKITELSISGLYEIDPYAFYGASGIKKAEIPTEAIAFIEKSNLEEVTIYGDDIISNAFASCSNLIKLVIGSTITKIGANAFQNCTSLTNVVIPAKVAEIGNGAFKFCSNLSSVEIGSGVQFIGEQAFANCENLEKAKFVNTSRWGVSKDSMSGKSLELEELEDPQAAAGLLKDKYAEYYWRRT